MGGPTKIKLSGCSLLNVIGNRFWKDFGDGMEAFLRPDWPSEVTLKASVIKFANQEGSELATPPSKEILGFGPPVGKIREGKVS